MAVASLFEDLLDQYKIEQHISEKRYTNLYQAYDVDDDRQVRLEILRPECAQDSSFAGRFVNRARALAQVRHSNIAQVLHVGKATGGAPYVAEAAVDGYSLSHRLEQLAQRNSPVNSLYALKLIRQLADALELAERLELFHYDLQPDNVLLKNVTLPTGDSVVLSDLFIPGKRYPDAEVKDKAAENRDYLSPEQRAGKDVTAASHVYSLGAMLYRLLAGHVPHRAVSRRDTVLARLFGQSTALGRERDDLTPATYTLVDRALRKDPRRRYPTTEVFKVALEGALAAEEARLGAAGSRSPVIARRPVAWLLPLLILALFLAVGAVATRSLVNRDTFFSAQETPGPSQTAAAGTSVPIAGGLAGATATHNPTSTSEAADTAVAGEAPTLKAGADEPTQSPTTAPTEPLPSATTTEEPTATPTPPATAQTPHVRVMHNMVNLRRGPGVAFSSFGTVTGGELLEVLAWNGEEENPWYLILTGDQRIGWIAATVVQPETAGALADVAVAATLPPTPAPTSTPTPTPTIAFVTAIAPTPDPGDLGGEAPTRPPVDPTSPPEPTEEPTLTPPSFTPSP
ncbi:MAG: protein kinase [Candidatus Promineofilum sp.]|nr:protein kinase [Promineifilum sp.]